MNVVVLPESPPDENAVQLFMRSLGATHDVATRLAAEGHSSLEEIAYVPMAELLDTRLEEPLLADLQAKARRILSASP